jgi:hypothetical protein
MGSPIRVEDDTDRQTDSAGTGHRRMQVWICKRRGRDEKGKRVVSNGGRKVEVNVRRGTITRILLLVEQEVLESREKLTAISL